MSLIMLGVLNMPDEMFWDESPISRVQHNAIRLEAAKVIQQQSDEIEDLKDQRQQLLTKLSTVAELLDDGRYDEIKKLLPVPVESVDSKADLDTRMANAGMTPVSEMLKQNALGIYSAHAGVTDLESFQQWLIMKREEFIRMQARMTLDQEEQDELFEWVVAHNALFGEVLANYRQAIQSLLQ